MASSTTTVTAVSSTTAMSRSPTSVYASWPRRKRCSPKSVRIGRITTSSWSPPSSVCEASLKRLNTDYIDLYQIHRPRSDTAIDETLRALDDLVHQGKVRYLGTSTFAAWQFVESLWTSEKHGLNRFVCEQQPYNLLDRRVERELMPMALTYGESFPIPK